MVRFADQLGYGTESVGRWVLDAEIEAGDAPGMSSSAERTEMPKLEQENRERCRAMEMLRQASAFVEEGARPPTQVMVQFIDENRDNFGVEPICTTLQVTPST